MSHVRYGYLVLRALLITTLFGSVSARAASSDERDAWIAANVVGTPEAYQSFLESHPTSAYAEKAFAAIANKIPAKPPKPPKVAPAKPGTPPALGAGSHVVSTGTSGGGVY